MFLLQLSLSCNWQIALLYVLPDFILMFSIDLLNFCINIRFSLELKYHRDLHWNNIECTACQNLILKLLITIILLLHFFLLSFKVVKWHTSGPNLQKCFAEPSKKNYCDNSPVCKLYVIWTNWPYGSWALRGGLITICSTTQHYKPTLQPALQPLQH